MHHERFAVDADDRLEERWNESHLMRTHFLSVIVGRCTTCH
jgi:hypothetical protein